MRTRLLRLVLVLGTLAGVVLLARSGGNGSEAPQLRARPAPHVAELGATLLPGRIAPVYRATPGLSARVTRTGVIVASTRSPDQSVTLAARGAGRAPWQGHANGATRTTPFGHETVVVDGTATEELLTVDRHVGSRTWTWSLSGSLVPRYLSDGRIGFAPRAAGRVSDLVIDAVAILDADGNDVTPAAARWTIGGTSKHATLELTLDDASLPLPYVIDPAFRAATTPATASAGSSITINVPSGVQAGDLLLAQVNVALGGTTPTVTPNESGWTLARNTVNGTVVGVWTYYRIATSAEPGSYTFNLGATLTRGGGMAAYSGINTEVPLDSSAGATGVNTATPNVTGLTTSVGNELLVYVEANTGARTVSAWPTIGGKAFTSRYNVSATGGALGDVLGSSKLSTASTSGATLGGNASWAAQVLAFVPSAGAAEAGSATNTAINNLAGTSIALTGPSGVAAGDLLVASIQLTAATTAGLYVDPPDANWHAIRSTLNGTTVGLYTFYKVATSGDASSPTYTFTFYTDNTKTTTISEKRNGEIVAYTGISSSSPAAYLSEATGTSANPNVSGINTSGANRIVVWTVGTSSNKLLSTPPTLGGTLMTTRATNGAFTPNGAVADEFQATQLSGASTSGATLGGSVTWAAQVFELVPDPTVPSQTFATTEGTSPVYQFYKSTTKTVYYNPAVAGDFTVTSTPIDSGNNVGWVVFKGVSLESGAFTHTAKLATSGYTSNSYAWTTSSTTSPGGSLATAYDTAGNSSADLTITKDVTAPTAAVTFPVDTAHYNAAGWTATLAGTASDAGSGISAVAISIQKDGGADSCWDGTDAAGHFTSACPNWVGADGTTGWSKTVSAAALSNGSSYTLTVKTTDNVSNSSTSAATSTFVYDTTAPTAAVTFPASGTHYNAAGWTGTIGGTAADAASSVATVKVAIQDGAGNYYDGSGFNNAGQTLLTATGTTDWSYALAADKLTNGHTYTLTVQTTDSATNANIDNSAASASFVYDTSAPTAAITSFGGGTHYNGAGWPGSLAGTSTDAAGSGTTVQLSLSNGTTCWDGTDAAGHFGSSCPNWVAVTGSTSWSKTLSSSALVNGTAYTLTVKTADGATNPNTDTNATSDSFVYDTSAPANAAISFPADGTHYNAAGWTGTISATANDSGQGGSGIGDIQLSVSDGTSCYTTAGGGGFTASCPNWISTGATASGTGDATANLSLASAKLTNGGSYTVSERAVDGTTSGSTSGTTATSAFVYDTSAPSAAMGYPGDGTHYNAAGWSGSVTGTSADTASTVASVAVSIQKDGGANACWDGTDAAGHFGASCPNWVGVTGTTSWSKALSTGALTNAASYAITVKTTDGAGNSDSSAITRSFVYDTSAPTATISFPAAGTHYDGGGWTGTISGTAADAASGIATVKIAIRDGAGNYYDGSGFDNVGETFLATGGTTANWTYALAAAKLTDGHTYTLSVQTTDIATNANVDDTAATASFVFDTTAPVAAISFPVAATRYNSAGWTGTIGGTAVDAGSNVATVKVAIQDGSGNYYDGTGFNNAGQTFLTATGTTSWTYPLASSKLATGHTYTVVVQTTDTTTGGNVDSSAATAGFVYDGSAPASGAISFPVDGTHYNAAGWTGAIAATASDAGQGASGISGLQLSISDGTDCYTTAGGGGFTASCPNWISTGATATGTNDASGSLALAAAKLTTGTTYTVGVRATDDTTSGNTSGTIATSTFVYDSSAPANAAIAFPADGTHYNTAGWTGTISATANDAGRGASGIGDVELSISNGTSCYTTAGGGGFTASCPNWLSTGATSSGTSNASASLALASSTLTNGTSYTVSERATDATDSGNTSGTIATSSFVYDTSAPANAAITFPADGGHYNAAGWTGTISASANDAGQGASGIGDVQLSISNGTSCYTTAGGGGFTASCPTWLSTGATATGGNDAGAAFALAAAKLTDGTTYIASLRAVDATTSGNTSGATAAASFEYDTSAPNAPTIAAPANGGKYGPAAAGNPLPTTWEGTASDNVGGVGLASVKVKVVRDADGFWWNAGTSAWVDPGIDPAASNDATLGAGWTLASPPTLGLVSGDTYTVSVYAVDLAGNSTSGSPVTSQFTYYNDTPAPTSAVQFPTNAAVYGQATDWDAGSAACSGTPASGICGTVSDTGGAGVWKVQVSVEDTSIAKWWNGSSAAPFTLSSETFLDASRSGGNWNLAIASGYLTTGHTYTLHVKATDNVLNAESQQTITFTFGDTVAPDAVLSLASSSHASIVETDSTAGARTYRIYLGTGGSFRFHADTTDATGVASVAFPDLSGVSGWTGSGDTLTPGGSPTSYSGDSATTYTFTGGASIPSGQKVHSIDAVAPTANEGDTSLAFVSDTTAPTGGDLAGGTGTTGGTAAEGTTAFTYNITGSFAVDVTSYAESRDAAHAGLATDVITEAEGTLSGDACSGYGSESADLAGSIVGGHLARTGTNGHCYRYTHTGVDTAGNSVSTRLVVKVDTTGPVFPAPTIAVASGSTDDAYATGPTVYLRTTGVGATSPHNGSFTVTAAPTDSQTGVTQVAFPSVTRLTGGATDTTSPYTSTYGWAAVDPPSSTADITATATNLAGGTSDQTFDLVVDNTPPTSGDLVPGSNLTGGATASGGTGNGFAGYNRTGGFSLGITPYAEATDATSSGLATIGGDLLYEQTGTLSGNVCSSYSAQTDGTSAVSGGSLNVTASAGDHCYRYTHVGTDNVGNRVTTVTEVKVDRTAPTTPTVSFNPLTGNAGMYFTTSPGLPTVYLNTSSGHSGTFTLTASASDSGTGIAATTGLTFPDFGANDVTGGNGNYGSSGGGTYTSNTYSWSTTATQNAGANVTATDVAGNSSTQAVAIDYDSAAPTGGAIAGAPTYSTSGSYAFTWTAYAEALGSHASGLASSTMTKEHATLANDACGGSWTSDGAVSGGTVSESGSSTGCFRYTLVGVDNVGNGAQQQTIVKVDREGPTGGSVTYLDGLTTATSASIAFATGASPSGVTSWMLQRAEGTLSGSTCSGYGAFATVSTAASPYSDASLATGHCYQYRLLVSDNAGHADVAFTNAAELKVTTASLIHVDPESGHTYQSGATLYVDGGASSFTLAVTSAGQVEGMTVDWADGATFVGGEATDVDETTAPAGTYPSGTYSAAAGANDTITLTRHTEGGDVVDTLHVVLDNTAPTGSISYADGLYSAASVGVTTSSGDGGGSGVSTARVERRSTTFDGSACGGWTDDWPTVTLVGGADSTVAESHCYQYRLVATDRLGNSRTILSASTAKIPDLTPPSYAGGASVTGDGVAAATLTIPMSEPVTCAPTPAGSFTVTYGGNAIPTSSITGVTCGGSNVTLTLAAPGPNNGQAVAATYTAPSSNQLVDTAGNAAATFGPASASNSVTDTVPPVVSSVVVNGSTLTIGMDTLLAGTAPSSGFTVTAAGSPVTVTSIAVSGSSVTLGLSPAVAYGQTVSIAYTPPGTNNLHDAGGAQTVGFTRAATNSTPAASSGPTPTPEPPPVLPAPVLVSASPDDGATVPSVSSIGLGADQTVVWSGMSVSRPDGPSVALDVRTGSSASWGFSSATAGMYFVSGTMTGAGGTSTRVLVHFTIWVPPVTPPGGETPPPPVVQKTATPTEPDVATSSDGMVTFSWPAGTFADDVVVRVQPQTVATVSSLPANSLIVNVTAYLLSDRSPVKLLGAVADVQFPNAAADAQPVASEDGSTWRSIPQLSGTTLPEGQDDGWYRDASSTIHVLTRHLTYFALPGKAAPPLGLTIMNARRAWLEGRTDVAIRVALTRAATVTTWFTDPKRETEVPGSRTKVGNLRAGVTVLRVRYPKGLEPGDYRIQVVGVVAEGQKTAKTAKLRIVGARPATPLRPGQMPRIVVLVRGVAARLLELPPGELGICYRLSTAEQEQLLAEVDARTHPRVAAVFVDLDRLPLSLVNEAHAVFPELQIVGLTSTPRNAPVARRAGVDAVVAKPATVTDLSGAVHTVLPYCAPQRGR